MRTKFYLITNKKDIPLGIVKSTSYNHAFEVFAERTPLTICEPVYAEILTADRLKIELSKQLPQSCLIGSR